MLDRNGRQIQVGDVVVYPVQRVDGIALGRAEVLDIHDEVLFLKTVKSDGTDYNFSATRPNRLAVVAGDVRWR